MGIEKVILGHVARIVSKEAKKKYKEHKKKKQAENANQNYSQPPPPPPQQQYYSQGPPPPQGPPPTNSYQGGPPVQIQIHCHNVRQDTNNFMPDEKPWVMRREGVCANIFYSSQACPTLVGLQEVKENQLHDILYGLGNEWTYYGVGRDDGARKGEFAPILFKHTEWELLSGNTYWLGDTPNRPSKGWDAAYPRIVTVVVVRHKQTGKVVNLLNTHYDHKGKKARINSSKQIMDLMKKTQGTSLLCGDLNSESHEEAYITFAQGGLLESSKNCRDRRGFEFTDTGFKKGRDQKSIDFIWSVPGVPVLKHEVLNSEYRGVVCSDHRPVTAIYQV